MNYPIIKQLVLKDFRIHFWPLLGLVIALPALAVTIAVQAESNWTHMGAILMVNSLMYLSFFVPIGSILSEKKLFIFSLPISPVEYTASKLIYGLLVFLGPWIAYLLVLPKVVAVHRELPAGAVVPGAILLTLFLLSYLVNTAVALVFETQLATVTVGLLIVPVVFAFLPLLNYVPDHLIQNWASNSVVWDSEAIAGMAGLLLLSLLTIALTFVLQNRKKSFV